MSSSRRRYHPDVERDLLRHGILRQGELGPNRQFTRLRPATKEDRVAFRKAVRGGKSGAVPPTQMMRFVALGWVNGSYRASDYYADVAVQRTLTPLGMEILEAEEKGDPLIIVP